MCDPIPASPLPTFDKLMAEHAQQELAKAAGEALPDHLPAGRYTAVPMPPMTYTFWFDGVQYTAIPTTARPEAAKSAVIPGNDTALIKQKEQTERECVEARVKAAAIKKAAEDHQTANMIRDTDSNELPKPPVPGRSPTDHFLINRQQETIGGQQKALTYKDTLIRELQSALQVRTEQLEKANAQIRVLAEEHNRVSAAIKNLANAYGY